MEAAPAGSERAIETKAETPVEAGAEGAPAQPVTDAVSLVETPREIPETPMPRTLELARTPNTPLPASVASPVVVPRPVARRRPRPRALKRIAMLVALLACLVSALLLWQNVSETHLYLYTLDPASGQMVGQQDLGGYGSIGALSNPAQDASSLFVSVSSTPAAQQQVLALEGSDSSWSVRQQFAAAPGRSTLSAGPGHALAVEDSKGLHMLASDGRVLWQVAGDAPLLGAHPFTPAFDSSTVYTIASARRGMVGAYDMRSGRPHWTVKIDDTLNYAPPVVLAGDTLYVAGDHTLYALNAITGRTHWKVAIPARALLYRQGRSAALIAAGASGLAAFNPQNGHRLWSFNGQPVTHNADGETDRLTPAQFYQANLSSDSKMVYATGVVWDTSQLQQQLWLFAVEAANGRVAWSVPIGTGFTNADAGRVFAPFIDAAHTLVVIEQAQSDGSHTVSAFDTGDGLRRWTMRLAPVTASAPALVQVASGNLGVFIAQNDGGLALRNAGGARLLLILAIASFFVLLLLWIIPLRGWLSNLSRLPRVLLLPLRALRGLWRFSRLLFAIFLLAVVIGAGLLTYTQLNAQQPYLRQVGGNGSTMWQHSASPASTLAGSDSSGALLVTGTADHTFALAALDRNGSPLWTLPAGEGSFTLPDVEIQTGAMLVALHGPATLPYTYAANDPAYPNPLAHYFALYLLNSQTGAVLWRAAPGATNGLEGVSVLGADAQFIYLAGRTRGQHPVVQLVALDKTDGMLVWRFYGPHERAGSAINLGAVLARGNLLYWQVNSAVYALNPQTGQVEWRDAIPEVDAQVAPLEDAQMAVAAGVLLIRRSDMYHALNLETGSERWALSGLGVDNMQMPGGILADGNKFILYGGGSIEAFDPASHSILWKHLDLAAVSNVALSPDGVTVYAVVFNNVDGSTNTQALVALDANSDLIRWTFQPGAQVRFVYAGSHIIYNAHGMIYLATCSMNGPGTCTHQTLYGVDAQTGKAHWQIDARRISALQATPDGQGVTFQIESSVWENLKAQLHV